ncbi:Ig-like domain-containing protein [Polaribacter sp. MED152]|uniref:Ig-like domain-containing protein n=1 Tax=Polaribacter sp. MED152 TaxID=313598 RepID=UPI000068CD96|nr:Ig-like domain-containing protein [Polaribacter sp. MED152]EAQ41110.1 hypothetical protein MED152_00310 [Polaribacter sp. MED152]
MKKNQSKLLFFFLFLVQFAWTQTAPEANNDSNTTEQNTNLTVSSPGLLGNDTDPNGDTLLVTEFLINGTTYNANETASIIEGDLTINADGSYNYEPAQDFLGNFPTVTYTISNGVETDSANLNITVILPPIAPEANDDTYETEVNTPLNISSPGVLQNDTDANGDTLLVTEFVINGTTYNANEIAAIAEGDLTINANGSLNLNPTFNYVGDLPTIIYRISDGSLISAANINIAVVFPPTAPIPMDDYDTVEINTTLNVAAPGVLANDTDINNDVLTVTEFVINGVGYPAGTVAVFAEGSFTINADGSYQFVPTPNYFGDVPVITYRITDGTFQGQALLFFTVERITDLLNIASFNSCNQGYTVDGTYKVRYTMVLENTSTARDYNESSLLRNIDIVSDLQGTFGTGCVVEVSEFNIENNTFTRDFVNDGAYPREFTNAAMNGSFLNSTSTSVFNQNAIDNLTLYPRQNVTVSYCVTIDPFCDGRSNPTPAGSGLDFTNDINITTNRGNDSESLTLTDFHTTEAIVAAGLFIPEFNDSLDPPGVINSDGTYDYINSVIITNEGTATANNINYNMGLGNFIDNGITFTELRIQQASGPTVTINPNYNGETDTFLLAPNNSLAPGEVVVLELFYLIEPYASTRYSFFYQNGRSFTQGADDNYDETTAARRRSDSYVTWSDNLGDHLDRYYVVGSPTEIPSSANQCECVTSSMRFLFDTDTDVSKTITSVNEMPNDILEHEEVTFEITFENSSEAVQLTNLQLVDDLTNSCGGNIVSVNPPIISSSTATTNPTLNANFNGVSDTDIFIGTDGVLMADETITVQFSVVYSEACIGDNIATFSARDPLGSAATSSATITVDASTDSDGDSIINSIDLDDDNDTIPDTEEYNGLDPLQDDDADFIPNYRDTDFDVDANADGIVDLFDFDNDGVPNHLDLDSDNDGILDINEAGNATEDTNNDGVTDNNVGANGLDNSLESDDSATATINYTLLNSDTDINFNYLDIDSDGDGIVDNIEAQLTTNYITLNGVVNNLGIDTAYPNGLDPIDTENDGIADYLDLNSDDDIREDIIEGWDTDADGTAETIASNSDVDNDGLDDAFDTDDTIVNPTNNQTPLSFPNEDNIDTEERDWREIIAIEILISDVTETEGNIFDFVLTLVTKRDNSVLIESASPIVINFSTAGGTGTTTQFEVATAPFDFTPVNNVDFTIPPFTNTTQFSVTSLEDNIAELSELFSLNGAVTSNNTDNTTITGIGTILDNDDPPSITMNDSREDEGIDLVHTITISNPSSTPIAININTNDDLAISPDDYTAISDVGVIEGTVDPNNANTQVSFSISSNLDNLNELDEENLAVIGVVTSNNVGVEDLSKVAIIVDVDPNPFIEITNPIVEEGNVLEFTITLLNANAEPMQNYLPINIILETIDDTTFATEDYEPINILTSIPAFTSTISQNVITVDDRLNEETEQLFLQTTTNLDNIANTTMPRGIGTIKDNDYPNLFSPNGDGVSDVFKISGIVEDYPNFRLVIVNRLGNEVYNYSNNGNVNPSWWDGTFNGNPVSTGVYFYTLDYNDGVTKPKSNFIQLIR